MDVPEKSAAAAPDEKSALLDAAGATMARLLDALVRMHTVSFTACACEALRTMVPCEMLHDASLLAEGRVRALSRSHAQEEYKAYKRRVDGGEDPLRAGAGRLACCFVEYPLAPLPRVVSLDTPVPVCHIWLPAHSETTPAAPTARS